jgi:23S rRNA G2445 N2-methylase RlmL
MQEIKNKLFATTAKGVEPVLAAELEKLGVTDIKTETGGVKFAGDLKLSLIHISEPTRPY